MKINVKQVLSEAVSFYKVNFKYLAGISLIMCIFGAAFNMSPMLDPHSLLSVGLILMLAIAALVLMPRLFLIIVIIIDSLFDKNRVTFGEAYRQIKGKYWIILSRLFLVVVISFIPAFVLIYMEIPFASAIGGVCSAFIMALYYMLIPIIALEPKTKQYLKKSIQRIKGNYTAALKLYLLTTTLLGVIIATLQQFFAGGTTPHIIAGTAYLLVFFFVFPFAETVIVIVYRQLTKDRQGISESDT